MDQGTAYTMTSRSESLPAGSVDMQTIADLAGVSRSTVSRALSDSPLVNKKTRERIQALASKHNFVINEAARNFRLRKTNIISVVPCLDIASEQQTSDPFFLEMIGYIADELAAREKDLLLTHAPIISADVFSNSRVYQQSEGVIFLGQGLIHSELNKLARGKLPFIVWGGQIPDRKYPLVGSDNIQGGYLSTRHLLEQGCKRIAFFGETFLPEMLLRHQGYCRALAEAGLTIEPALRIPVPVAAGHANQIINAFLDSRVAIDGIMCCSDLIAMSAISCLGLRGLRVPVDIPVVGYDNLNVSPRTNPPLTTIDQKMRLSAQNLVAGLFTLLAGKEIDDAIQPAELIIRGSSFSDRSTAGT